MNGHTPSVVELKYGESIDLRSKNLKLEFSSLEMDSRCPDGADCIWSGEGVIHLKVNSEKEISLKLPVLQSVQVDGIPYRFSLIKLNPYPKSDRHPDKEDYTAYIKVEPIITDEPLVQVKSDKKLSMNNVL